jgi:hypothetical protein
VNNPAPAPAPRYLGSLLGQAETLHAQAIDLRLERVQRVRNALGFFPRLALVKAAGTLPKFRFRCQAHGSIRSQEPEPLKSKT